MLRFSWHGLPEVGSGSKGGEEVSEITKEGRWYRVHFRGIKALVNAFNFSWEPVRRKLR
jgi:hypothetical protein